MPPAATGPRVPPSRVRSRIGGGLAFKVSYQMKRPIFALPTAIFSLVAVFFIFYEARLLYVTRGLKAVRAGGNGAYVGAVAFPLLALLFIWGARRCWRASRVNPNVPAHKPKG